MTADGEEEEPCTETCHMSDNQTKWDDDFVIEDFQDDMIGPRHCAVIDADSEYDLHDSLPTITARSRVQNDSATTYSNNLVSSRSHPQKVYDSGYCTSDVDNVPRQPYKFQKSQYGSGGFVAKSPSSLQPKWGRPTASYHSASTYTNRAMKYEDDISRGDYVASAETVSAEPMLHSQDDMWSFGEKRYNDNVARAHCPVESTTVGRGGSTAKPWRNGGTSAQNSIAKHRLDSTMPPHNKSRFCSSVIVDKFNQDELPDLDSPVTNHCRGLLSNDARYSTNKSLGKGTSKVPVETGLWTLYCMWQFPPPWKYVKPNLFIIFCLCLCNFIFLCYAYTNICIYMHIIVYFMCIVNSNWCLLLFFNIITFFLCVYTYVHSYVLDILYIYVIPTYLSTYLFIHLV